MRTSRSLTVCRGGGGFSLPGVSLRGGSPCQEGGSPCQGGLLARGSPCWGGLLAGGPPCQGGSPCQGWGSPCQGWGSPCQGWGSPCQGWGSPCRGFSLPETSPVDRITDTSKNITLATTSLRPVIIAKYSLTLILHRIHVSWNFDHLKLGIPVKQFRHTRYSE